LKSACFSVDELQCLVSARLPEGLEIQSWTTPSSRERVLPPPLFGRIALAMSRHPPMSAQVPLSKPPLRSLYLMTPFLTLEQADRLAETFAALLGVVPVASALVRVAPGAEGDARAIVAPIQMSAVKANCAVILENEPRLAMRLGMDGVHVAGAGHELDWAIQNLKPEHIVGAGALRTRDEAMSAGEKGADYVMFGEPRAASPPMPLDLLIERVGWWSEIFEVPCVAYGKSIDSCRALAVAGADFVALGSALWEAPSPIEAAKQAFAAISDVAGPGR